MKYQINVYDKSGLVFTVETNENQMKDLSSTKSVFREIRGRFKKYQGFTCEVKEYGPAGIRTLDCHNWDF